MTENYWDRFNKRDNERKPRNADEKGYTDHDGHWYSDDEPWKTGYHIDNNGNRNYDM